MSGVKNIVSLAPKLKKKTKANARHMQEGHYFDVFQTPLIVSGKPLESDDYQPRANAKKLGKAGKFEASRSQQH